MNVFITGITGTIGTALASYYHSIKWHVWGCCRSERGYVGWAETNGHLANVIISDAIDMADPYTELRKAMPCCTDLVIHCAAMKHVEICERYPSAAMYNNVDVTTAVTEYCDATGTDMVLVSSDKACLPQSVYGATKLLAEKIVLQAGYSVVRLGNVIGSSGSVFHKWHQAIKEGCPISLTDPSMTRYFIPVEEAASFIANYRYDDYISIPRMKYAMMGLVAGYLGNRFWLGDKGLDKQDNGIRIIGRRPGESQHQWLVAPGDKISIREDSILISNDGGMYSTGICSGSSESSINGTWDTEELLRAASIIK